MHGMQVKALKNSRSVDDVVFSSETSGSNHCQIGNIGLAVETIIDWLNRKT
jgi:hypothetical protein